MFWNRRTGFEGSISGCLTLDDQDRYTYLPLVNVASHTIIQSSAYTAITTQTYYNPLESRTIDRLQYSFPLFDGVSVVDFECHIGDRIIKGLVKERHEAKAIFEAAAKRGETAGLLDQLPSASDVFTTQLSNIPPKSTLQVIIKYVGELKHDMGTDSMRLVIPTAIAPRYGTVAGPLPLPQPGQPLESGISIKVDIEMAEACPIQKISSPSNPIEVSLGTLSTDSNAEHSPLKASATLALEQSALNEDFILQIAAKDISAPQALLETYTHLSDQKAIMATFVPKFALKPEMPEIIFIVDRSGSMENVVRLLKSAMQVCVKSLSPGIRFNILSYGSRTHLLWDKSKVYNAESLREASKHIKTFKADFGGTETMAAVRRAIESRRADMSTELMLLTDGDIWQQNEFFEYLNSQVRESNGRIRLFSLGIGGQVSHALIEGCARAGCGFSQSVADGERFDGKIVRMIKAAVMPHMFDCKFRLQFEEGDGEAESLDKIPILSTNNEGPAANSKTISLYDPEAEKQSSSLNAERSEPLLLEPPAIMYAPCNVPTLSSFSRTTVYLLLSGLATQKTPKAVHFSATTPQGRLELQIPLSKASVGTMVHQLAARKAILELEEGRGWVADAHDETGKLLRDTQLSKLEDLTRLEGVRLGTKFQVASKWCSFVAIEANSTEEASRKRQEAISDAKPVEVGEEEFEFVEAQAQSSVNSGFVQTPYSAAMPPPPPPPYASAPAPGSTLTCYRSAGPQQMHARHSSHAGASETNRSREMSVADVPVHGSRKPWIKAKKSVTGILQRQLVSRSIKSAKSEQMAAIRADTKEDEHTTERNDESPLLERLIASQSFDGCWTSDNVPWKEINADATKVQSYRHAKDLLATALVVLYLEEKMKQHSEVWELVVDKARSWIESNQSAETAKELDGSNDNLWTKARQLLAL